jgi:hypothetical protein
LVIYVDIDDTICRHAKDSIWGDYSTAFPITERIEKINKLYDEGNEIHYWTARGTVTGVDWYLITANQLKEWGAKFHRLSMGKPAYDLFICDKAINSDSYF